MATLATMIAIGTAAAYLATPPASAEHQPGKGIAFQYGGFVLASTTSVAPPGPGEGYDAAATCDFEAVAEANGTLTLSVVGTAWTFNNL